MTVENASERSEYMAFPDSAEDLASWTRVIAIILDAAGPGGDRLQSYHDGDARIPPAGSTRRQPGPSDKILDFKAASTDRAKKYRPQYISLSDRPYADNSNKIVPIRQTATIINLTI
ncbi:MAG: hypothetical protein ACR2P3_07615 [Geminicoccaceae bacterium]